MVLAGWVTLLALVLYLWVSARVGSMRARHGIKAPSMTGHPEFERAVRVQANTLENLVPFLAALWLAGWSWRWDVAAILGLAWVGGRVWYALGYYRDPGKRGLGFMVGFVAQVLLMLAAAGGLTQRCLA